MAQIVAFDANGDPDLGTPAAGGVAATVPSGDALACQSPGSTCV